MGEGQVSMVPVRNSQGLSEPAIKAQSSPPKVLRLQGGEDWQHRDEAALHPRAPARHKQEQTNKTGSSKPKTCSPRIKGKQITYERATSPFMPWNLGQGLLTMKVTGGLCFPYCHFPSGRKVCGREIQEDERESEDVECGSRRISPQCNHHTVGTKLFIRTSRIPLSRI